MATEEPTKTANEIDHEFLFAAIEGFIDTNCIIESTAPIDEAIELIIKCTDLQEIFAIPLQCKLFNMDTALKWVLFLTIGPAEAKEQGDVPFAKKFSPREALELVSQVYDKGVKDNIWVHFEDEEDEEETE